MDLQNETIGVMDYDILGPAENRANALLKVGRPRLGALTLNDANIRKASELIRQLVVEHPIWRNLSDGGLFERADFFHAVHQSLDPIQKFDITSGPRIDWRSLNIRLAEVKATIPDAVFADFIRLISRLPQLEIEQSLLKRNGSRGGNVKAANAKAKPNPEKDRALALKRKHPELSAAQIKTRETLRASERTIRGWLSAGC